MISRVSEAITAKRMQIDPYCQQWKCNPLNVVSSDIRVMQIFAGFRRYGASNQGRLGQKAIFRPLCSNISKTVQDMTKVTIDH